MWHDVAETFTFQQPIASNTGTRSGWLEPPQQRLLKWCYTGWRYATRTIAQQAALHGNESIKAMTTKSPNAQHPPTARAAGGASGRSLQIVPALKWKSVRAN